jgi:hypothetical protein
MSRFLVAFDTEVIVDAENYETAVTEAYKTVKSKNIHISKIMEIKPLEEK